MAGLVYIIANRKNGALYTGVTNAMSCRAIEHRDGTGSRFAANYGIYRLVYVEFTKRSTTRFCARSGSRSGVAPGRSR